MLFQVIVNGLLQGGFYACIGVTFSIVFGIMRIVNLAQGMQIILGAYLTFAPTQAFGVDPFLTLPVAESGFSSWVTSFRSILSTWWQREGWCLRASLPLALI